MPKDNAPQMDTTNAATNPTTGSTPDSATVTKDASTGGANTAGDGQNQEGTGGATDANTATDANVANADNATGDGGAKAETKDASTPSQPTARKGTEKKSNFKSVGNNFYCRLRLYNGLKQGRFSVKERKTIYNPFKLGVCFKVSF